MSGRLGYGSEQSLGGSPGTVPSAIGDVPLGVKAHAVVCGTATTCIIHGDGLVRCWGLGYKGSLATGSENSVGHVPTLLPRDAADADIGVRVLDLVVSAHACALVEAAEHAALGHLRCWGPNQHGQLGYGNTRDVGDTPATTPRLIGNVPVGALVRQVDVGLYHTCVVTEAFRLRCWGGNEFGQLGYGRAGTLGDTAATVPALNGDVDVGPLRVLRVSCGAWHTCVLLEDQSVKCWGRGETASGPGGAIGYGDDQDMSPHGYVTVQPAQLRAVRVGGKVALLRSGRAHTCAVMLDENQAEDDEVGSSRIRCWGWNSFGQLGYGHRRSVGADASFLPMHAGDVPVDPVKHDPWMVIDIRREFALLPYGRHGAELPFRVAYSPGALAKLAAFGGALLCAVFLAWNALCRRSGPREQIAATDAPRTIGVNLDSGGGGGGKRD
jgi:alpha-tubulin suppressor-like RCC1 family protein